METEWPSDRSSQVASQTDINRAATHDLPLDEDLSSDPLDVTQNDDGNAGVTPVASLSGPRSNGLSEVLPQPTT